MIYLNLEHNFNPKSSIKFVKNNMSIPICLVSIYLFSIYFGKKIMKHKQAYKLTNSLICWNIFLSIFSFFGTLRVLPSLLYYLLTDTFDSTICSNPNDTWGKGPSGLWVQLFIFSKIPELFDTFFIVARKKPLMFLHWYHHVTVLLYCWHSYGTSSSQTLFFVSMNYMVHTIMYGYYALMALKMKPFWLSPVFVTTIQIIQMIIGTYIQFYASYKYITNSKCNVDGHNIFWGGIMYSSYLYLFVNFAFKRYKNKKKI